MGNDSRKRAIALKAADARELIGKSLPMVLKYMTHGQVAQVQRVLDAAVVNPAVQREYKEAMRRSIVSEGRDGGNYEGVYQNGRLVLRDVNLARRAERINQQQIPVTSADRRVQIDFKKLLDGDAFKPVTDNPDEERYLAKVKAILVKQGVWVRFEHKLVRDPEEPSRWMIDPRTFECWLSVGRDGDTIPTETGLLTRKAILGAQIFGAGYYDEVHRGPIERALERETNRLLIEIQSGIDQHHMIWKIRHNAAPGVTRISDALGGADFPDRSIWDYPRAMVHRAMELNVDGNVRATQAYLVVAAIATRNSAKLLADYIDDMSEGAERAVKVLKVAKAAGEVAEVGLAVTTGVGIVRAGARAVGTEVAAKTAKDKAVDAAAERLVGQMVAKDPSLATDLAKVRWVPGPKGSVGGRGIKPNQSSGNGKGFSSW
jgi:hypothetical protein